MATDEQIADIFANMTDVKEIVDLAQHSESLEYEAESLSADNVASTSQASVTARDGDTLAKKLWLCSSETIAHLSANTTS